MSDEINDISERLAPDCVDALNKIEKKLATDQEINEAVARKLGWTHDPKEDIEWSPGKIDQTWRRGDQCYRYSKDVIFALRLDYCHSIAAAWEIVEYLTSKSIHWTIWKEDGDIHCSFVDTKGSSVAQESSLEVSDTAPMAICLVFLKLP